MLSLYAIPEESSLIAKGLVYIHNKRIYKILLWVGFINLNNRESKNHRVEGVSV